MATLATTPIRLDMEGHGKGQSTVKAILTPVRLNLAKKFRESREYRNEFFRKRAKGEIAMQIRKLRELRKLRQIDLANQATMKQSAVSRIEQAEYSGWTFRTLMKVAEALDARLKITFQPMEEVIAEYERRENLP